MTEKQLPFSLESESGVLGSILIDPGAIHLIADFLQPEHFYRDAHRTIYETMLYLAGQNIPADFVTLPDELETRGKLDEVGGSGYIVSLINQAPTSANVEYYARNVAKMWEHRALIHAAGMIAALGYERDENSVEKAEAEILKITQRVQTKQVALHRDAAERYMAALNELHNQYQQNSLIGVPTGYPRLDKTLGGLRKSKMYILAARPAIGKTALALCMADAAVQRGFNVLFFSLEMEEEELMQRWMAMMAKVDSEHLRDGNLSSVPDREGLTEWDRVIKAYEQILKLPGKLLIDDTPGNTLHAMRSKSRRMQADHGIDLIIVDYLQFAKLDNETDKKFENRRLEVEGISRGLKELARELKVPVLALAQLNRNSEGRADREPQLSDLREGGGIEQDADVVMLIHNDPATPAGRFDLLVKKNRNGKQDEIPLYFIGAETRFYPVVEA